MSWMKHFTYLAFLCTFFEYRGASGTKGTCVCTYGDEVYNLTTLQSTDEYKPRFTIRGGKKMPYYMFGYNPCTSFIKTGKKSSCLNDVAICMWAENGGIPLNNGNQSTATCGTDTATGTPQLIYQAALYGPEFHSTVNLICNRTKKTVKEATFVQDPNNEWNFFLSHICACAGGCPLDPTSKPTLDTTKPIPSTNKPTKTTTASSSPWDIWEPVIIAAGSMIFVFIVISIVVIRLLLKRQNTPNEAGERQRLIGEEDESRNSFTKLNDAENTANLRYASSASLIKSASSSSCNNITVPNKDVFDKTRVASVPV